MAKAVYIHIPFCTNKCFYCDFNSYVVQGQPVMEYLKALNREMEMTTAQDPPGKIRSIFIGGGTPTVLNPQEMEYLFRSILRYFPKWEDDIEFTVEANPGTVEKEKLSVMKAYGVNRLSMGVQAFQDKLLSYIGRIHTVKEVYQSIEDAQKEGFTNLSIDLMLGLPHQTKDMVSESLEKAIQLQLPHFSVYSLKVEENTRFHRLYQKGELPLPNEDSELDMYLLTIEQMEEHGYRQYEISNFARLGFESKHNITYWRNEDYYGLGAGAHGYINNKRHENIKGIKPYIDALLIYHSLPRVQQYLIDWEEKKEDMLMLGLRMLDGVTFNQYEKLFHEDMYQKFGQQIDKLVKAGLLIKDHQGIRLSKKGIIYGNEVFAEFISI